MSELEPDALDVATALQEAGIALSGAGLAIAQEIVRQALPPLAPPDYSVAISGLHASRAAIDKLLILLAQGWPEARQ